MNWYPARGNGQNRANLDGIDRGQLSSISLMFCRPNINILQPNLQVPPTRVFPYGFLVHTS